MSAKTKVTSEDVLAALRKGPFREPAHSWFTEISDGTGAAAHRRADALACSLWPSRGIYLAGIEVKVSKSDWRAELDQPTKSQTVQRFCTYWWIAAPEGVVDLAELPPNWGLYVFAGGKVKVAKAAPKLEAEPMTVAFMASFIRCQEQAIAKVRSKNRSEGWNEARAQFGPDAIEALNKELCDSKWKVSRFDDLKKEHDNLIAEIRKVEDALGLKHGELIEADRWSTPHRHMVSVAELRLARALSGYATTDLIAHLRGALSAFETLGKLAAEASAADPGGEAAQ